MCPIRNKLPRKLTNDVILHDNVQFHVAQTVQDLLGHMNRKALQHPPFSPDLPPFDFHVFGLLKKILKGRLFHSDTEVEFSVTE